MSEKPMRKTRETVDDFREVETGHRNGIKSDPAQESAIHMGAGPCAVIAGPGSGKTHVLIERIRYLIQEKCIEPSSILVLTFSRAAAAHMRRRFLKSCPHPETVFGTFHSVFYRILQDSSRESYKLADPYARQQYLRHLCSLRPAFLPEKCNPEELQLLISRYKNGLPCTQQWITELISTYDAYMQGRGWLDFDDMILQCRKILLEDPGILSMWRNRFRWILVDEFQDVSPSQYEVLALLAEPSDNLFIVGDDDQSIYGFRGADPLMMQRFLSDYIDHRDDSGDRKVYLTTNYRCGSAILKAGASLIRCNRTRIEKAFQSGSGVSGRFFCRPFTEQKLEYAFIIEELLQMSPEERSRTAVIFRTHAAAQQFLQILGRKNIPFSAAGGKKPQLSTDRNEIQLDLAAYYKAAEAVGAGMIRREDLLRIMNKPERFLSGSFAPSDYMSKEELLAHAGYEHASILDLIKDLEILSSLSPRYSLRYLVRSVGYGDYAGRVYKESNEILEDLLTHSADCRTRREWIRQLEGKQKDFGKTAVGKNPSSDDRTAVKVVTMHACKGLEFDNVYIPDLNEGSIPSRFSWTSGQVEEERRLLYVAMTRARHCLTLTYLEGTDDRPAAPSRFLLPLLQPGSGSERLKGP